jgi:hypothetical protein
MGNQVKETTQDIDLAAIGKEERRTIREGVSGKTV